MHKNVYINTVNIANTKDTLNKKILHNKNNILTANAVKFTNE